MNKEMLVGTYQLLSWENRFDSRRTGYPLGKDAKGIISYSDDGYMFVHIMAADSKRVSGGDLFGGDEAEFAEAAMTHLSCTRTYRIKGDEVIHEVQICSFPNWVGTDQRRRCRFEDGNLFLSAEGLQVGDETATGHLIWQPIGK